MLPQTLSFSYWCIKGRALERGGLLISLKNSDPSPQRCACVAHDGSDAIFISQKAKGCGLVWLATAPENDLRRLFKGEHQHTKPKCFCCWQLHFYLLMLQTCFLGGKYGEKCFIILGQSKGRPCILCESFQQIFW